MRRTLNIMVLSAVALLLGSCTAMMNSSSYGSSDLYRSDNRIQVAQELKAKAEAEKAEAEARQAMWEARIAEANAANAEAQYYGTTTPSYTSIVADDYQSAYARRLYGFNSPSYKLPSSYYSYATYNALRYATAYDPAYYNIMISGDQVWVEPRYITSMFGSWGATNVSFGIYASPWNYGWNVYVDPFYYTWWGYPRYSWYDWNWTICYNPCYWGAGYYPYFYGYYPGHYGYYAGRYPGYHRPPQPPQPQPDYRPGNRPGGGSGGSYKPSEDRRNSAPRYTSPTSNKNYGGGVRSNNTTVSRPNSGATSVGINTSKTYRPSSGVNNRVQSSSNSGTRNNTATSNKNTNTQRSSNYRQSTSSSSSSSYRQSTSSSNSSSYRSSSSSNAYRQTTISGSSSSRGSSSSYSSGSSRSGGSTSSRR